LGLLPVHAKLTFKIEPSYFAALHMSPFGKKKAHLFIASKVRLLWSCGL